MVEEKRASFHTLLYDTWEMHLIKLIAFKLVNKWGKKTIE